MMDIVSQFHFLRPSWLWAIPFVTLVWLWSRNQTKLNASFQGVIAPHLLTHLTTGTNESRLFTPQNLLLPAWLLCIFALAGPTASVQPSPFAEDKAGLMIVLRMADSMESEDLAPTRLERVRIKLKKLLQERKGAKTGLVVYSGSSHLVMPLTTDGEVINHMLQSLSPDIMPRKGDTPSEALQLAASQIKNQAGSGSILLIADAVENSQNIELDDIPPIQAWAPLPNQSSLAASGINQFCERIGAKVQLFTPDESDIALVERQIQRRLASISATDSTRWNDAGYWLLPVIAILALCWSRRGWSLSR